MKIEDIAAVIVIALVCTFGAWVVVSFVNWNIDPRAWSGLDRTALVVLSVWAYAKVVNRAE